MTLTPTDSVTTNTLHIPGGELYYEIRGSGTLLVLVGAPMDAPAFAPLADLMATDHTVLTTDPRGVNRSRLDDPEADSTPELRADDLSRLITHLDLGPAIVLGSSGGAVTALALVQAHPDQVHTAIAHEPPLEELLDDREQRRRDTQDIVDTYRAHGSGAAWAKFMAAANLPMPDGDEWANAQPAEPDPVQQATERHFFLHELGATTSWQPDIAALKAAPTRIIVGIGEQSRGQLCDLTSTALSAELGVTPTFFPGDHTGFVSEPATFAARLRAVLG